ncbi:MAG: ATP-binding protein [ANME-2 cluster archaeon]|nr:ATP-binding protein [ANME-2 cluster archaeon]MBC2701748.1 ATP-binding protein [ANME-2 cluster archaeon]MBC2707954.1 ATP-binding protein [ANME-2 cluster archaeon]MBC2745726.1 ATP-binding protein [ANME-2 cluster archaeon]
MHDIKLETTALVLTAEIYNRTKDLIADDLPSELRKHYWDMKEKTVLRPMNVTARDMEELLDIHDPQEIASSLPFMEYEEFGQKIRPTVFDIAAKWLAKQEHGVEYIKNNPVLAHFYENYDSLDVSYEAAIGQNEPKEASRQWVDSLIAHISTEKDTENLLKLVHITVPEEIDQTLDKLVLNQDQKDEMEKMVKAIQFKDYLKRIGLVEVGKLLFVGPPGTGKTSTARAMSAKLKLPFLEVRLSMITDQYLGETAKNIDRVFDLAKRMSPCILFIDEFDFMAKTRSSDENAALKRAVNSLLKAIDEISLVKHGVLLIGATNHPQLLDSAAWRRFDDILDFPLPDKEMRQDILDIIISEIEGEFDTEEIAAITKGYSGSDLKLVIRESVLNALMTDRMALNQDDLIRAVGEFNKRTSLKYIAEEEL